MIPQLSFLSPDRLLILLVIGAVWLGLIDLRNMATSLVLLPIAPLGVWIGVRIARRIDPLWFYRFVYFGMLLAGLKLLWDGFVG